MSRHEVQILRAVGMAQAVVAAQTGVSVRSVRRIEDEPRVATSDTEDLSRARRVGRPSLAAPWTVQLQAWLAEDRALLGVELLRRAREAGYRGGKSALYALVRRLRPAAPPVPVVRFEGAPGEFSQHDFGQVTVHYRAGASAKVHFFASRLKWSRFAHVGQCCAT
jgi:transposase